MLQWARIQAHCSTGGNRTRDPGSDNAVIPTAFATGNQNFLLFLQELSKARQDRRDFMCIQFPAVHMVGVEPDNSNVIPPAFALLKTLSSTFKEGPRLRTNNWCDWYSLDVITPAFLRRRRSTLRVVTYKASSSINPTQWSAPNAPAANRASTLNTSSEKPPMFKMSDRSSACVWA